VPSLSQAQAIAARIAAHHPEQLYERNKGMLSMSKGELHKYASTSEKGLPKKKALRGIGRRARK